MDSRKGVTQHASVLLLTLGWLGGCGQRPEASSYAEPAREIRPDAVPAEAATGKPEATAAWDGRSFAAFRDAAGALSFDLPATAYAVDARHFPRTTPPHKIKHLYEVHGPQGPVLTIECWHDPSGAPLDAWFDATLRFMVVPGGTQRRGTVAGGTTEAIFVTLPAGHVQPRVAAVFQAAGRAYCVTCLDADDPAAMAVFDRALASFSVEPEGSAP